jgi:hypothetical protein
MARNCDQIATMPCGTAGDGCPTRAIGMAVELGRWRREGTGRTGGDGRAMATDLAVELDACGHHLCSERRSRTVANGLARLNSQPSDYAGS